MIQDARDMQTVLIIEDDDDQADLLAYSLRKNGFATRRTATGAEGIEAARRDTPDLVLLDVRLPDLDGFEVCRRILQTTSVAVMLLSACQHSEEDRVRGLTIGAKDYLAKSHSHTELLMRIKQLLEGCQENAFCRIAGDCLRVCSCRIYRHGVPLELTGTEFKFLVCLVNAYPAAVSYRDLSTEIWTNAVIDRERLKVHASRLRSKLGDASCCDCQIKAQYGTGYSLYFRSR
jgi:DNA-binding response OmpR family regulator